VKQTMKAEGRRDWCFVTHKGEKIPSGHSGELGVSGDSGECSTRDGGGLALALRAARRGDRGGGGALRGVRVITCRHLGQRVGHSATVGGQADLPGQQWLS
jgi:hypothetical protein